ncbi:MAG: hypothetical protein A2X86_03315 [Bdellovibrionales bacterium GWA2_49_15]|nr:MAG: hypothetical protein A2X86_03315 [Bdellovibrionales bacterium GWA2_49_15]
MDFLGAKRTVLIVDDDKTFRRLARELLQETCAPIQILEAEDGLKGITMIHNQKFDLMLLDLNMPKADGKTVMRAIYELRENQRPSNVLVISGRFESEKTVPSSSGIFSFMGKPFNSEALVSYVQNCFNKTNAPVKPRGVIDVKMVNPFIESTLKVLDINAGITAEKKNLYIRKDDVLKGDVTALLPLQGALIKGSMALSFEQPVFLSLVNAMLGENYTEINEENSSCIGELCNQIFGLAKTQLNEMGHKLVHTLPTIITGREHKISHFVKGDTIVIEFATKIGDFFIETVFTDIHT